MGVREVGNVSDPLTDAANAISPSSPKIRAFAQLAAQRIEAIEAKLTPPPPPPPAGRSVFVIHYADSAPFAPPSKYDQEYALAVSSWGADPYLSSLTTCRGCAYRTCVEVNGTTSFEHSEGGMTRDVAKTGGMILLDTAGNPLTPPANTPAYAGDIGSPAYQSLWCKNVNAYLDSMKVVCLFLDNVTGYCWFGTPSKYPTEAAWRTAYLSMLAAQKSLMPGIYRIANAGNPPDVSWMSAVAKLVDGVLIEGYDGSSSHNALIAAARAAGADVYGNVLSDVAPWTKAAAMHKAFRAAGGQYFGVGSGGPDPYDPVWVNA